MPLSFPETERPALIVGQDGILRAGWQPAPNVQFTRGSGGLPTRRRLPTCPTISAEFCGFGKTKWYWASACQFSCHNFGVDVVLTGVQPEEIALNPAEAGTVGDSRIAASVEALFREHYGRITGMLTRMTGDRANAEEIASDVFHKLSQRPALLDSREDLTAWIYRVATNAGCDALRTNWRRRKREAAAGLEGIHAAAAPSRLA